MLLFRLVIAHINSEKCLCQYAAATICFSLIISIAVRHHYTQDQAS